MSDIESGLEFKTTNREEVEEVGYGMYVWVNPDGDVFADDDENVMNVFCMKNDRKAIQALIDAARHHGAGPGKPVWWPGKRRIDDEELQEQLMREKLGLEPDPLNPAALRDEEKMRHFHG